GRPADHRCEEGERRPRAPDGHPQAMDPLDVAFARSRLCLAQATGLDTQLVARKIVDVLGARQARWLTERRHGCNVGETRDCSRSTPSAGRQSPFPCGSPTDAARDTRVWWIRASATLPSRGYAPISGSDRSALLDR